MMRGPTYDDSYITRKMSSLHGPTFAPPGGYGRPPMGGYMQDTYIPYSTPYSTSTVSSTTYTPTSTTVDYRDDRRSVSPIRTTPTGYRPSAATQLILNRLALRNAGHRNSLPPMGRGYPPMGPPPPRMVPRMAPAYPSYYDYDYGYGYGYPSYGGGYGYAPPPPRMSRYDSYLDDEMPEPTYGSRYRSRVPETLEEMDIRDKASARPPPPAPAAPPSSALALRDYPPLSVNDVDEDWSLQPRRPRKAHLQSSPGIEPPAHTHVPGETEGDRHLAKMQARYPSLSEPQMLQDHVDKMRIRLKSIAFSLDPSGPVPDIIVPERPKKGGDGDKKYTQALEYHDLPKLASRRQRYYPEDEYMKDNLRIKCLSHYKTTRTAADYWKPKQYNPDDYKVASESTSRYDKLAGAKWEEPDTVFGTQTEKKPYSKPLTDGTSEDTDDKKERRRKKKSKERDISDALATELGALSSTTPAPPSDLSTSEADKEVDKEASLGDVEDLDEKERKKLEKKKRKAEREAAAKAAMEAELAALAAAEAELARLEAESNSLKTDSPAPAEVSAPAETPAPAAPAEETPAAPAPAPAEPATEVKSESAADKSGEPSKAVRKLQSATHKIMAVGAFLRTHVTQKKSSGTEVDDAPAAAAPEEEQQPDATAALDTTDIDTFGGGNEEGGLQGTTTITLPAEIGGEAFIDDALDAAADAAAAAASSAVPSSANRSEEDLLE